MKDQRKLLNSCIHADIPACVFQGDDSCMVEILKAAFDIYGKHGCSAEFLYDFQLLINEVRGYQKEHPEAIKLPGLLPSEAAFTREDMVKMQQEWYKLATIWKNDAEKASYVEYSKEKLCNGKFGILESGDCGILSNMLYDRSTEFLDQGWFYFLRSRDSKVSFSIKTGIRHKGCKVLYIEDIPDEVALERYSVFSRVPPLFIR